MKSRIAFHALTALALSFSLTLTILPLLPNAKIPLLQLQSPSSFSSYRPPAAPLVRVTRKDATSGKGEGLDVSSEEVQALQYAGLSDSNAADKLEAAYVQVEALKENINWRVGIMHVCKTTRSGIESCIYTERYKDLTGIPIAAIVSYPASTPAPVLLLISAASQSILFLGYLLSFVPWNRILSPLTRLASCCTGRRQACSGDSESVRDLIQHQSFPYNNNDKEDRLRWGAANYAFLAIWLPCFAFGCAGADILLAGSVDARNRAEWTDSHASLGSGAYLLAILSFALLLPIITYVLPFALQLRESRKVGEESGHKGAHSTSTEQSGKVRPKHDSVESFAPAMYILPYTPRPGAKVTVGAGDSIAKVREEWNSPNGPAKIQRVPVPST